MIAVTYQLTLLEPVLATALAGEPNSAVSHDYIPGSLVRGLVAGELRRQESDLSIAQRHWLFNGQTRYLHAYPFVNKQRSLPAPRSWRKDKKVEGNPRIEDRTLLSEQESEFEATKDVTGFVVVSDEHAMFASRRRHITVHTLRDRFAGRPQRGQGAVYQYDALPLGAQFSGAVLVATNDQAEELLKLLPMGQYRLGGARTAGYGLAKLHNLAIVNKTWHEYNTNLTDIATGQTLIITLLSDTILRDRYGATHTDLAATLGLPEPVAAYKQTTVVGGFNRKWGTPLPQEQALRAGSVFVWQAAATIPLAQWQKWLEQGVGERCSEGFGRLAVNWQQADALIQSKPDQHQHEIVAVTLTPGEQATAQRIATRRRRLALDRDLAEAIKDLEPTIKGQPTNSQLSRVRIILRSALKERDPSRMSELFRLDGDKNVRALKPNAQQKFARCRIGDPEYRLSDWIKDLSDNPEKIWDGPFKSREDKPLGGIAPEDWLTEEYALRLIDGVLEQMMQKNRKGDH